MNQGIRKLIVTMSLMLCLFGTVFATKVNAEDANSGNDVVTYERKVRAYTAERVSKYLAGENSYPELEGYLFAGWYTDEKCDETCYLGTKEPSGMMYALFVPKQVLGVQAQIKVALTDESVTDNDKVTSLRFVTSVDSLNYREVGFYVTYTIGGQEYTSRSSSKKVYDELYYVDSTEGTIKETPQSLFCNLSKYFKAGTVLDIPESLYGTEFTVQPFWTTMEGDVVKGKEVVKSVDVGCVRDEVYVSSATDAEGNPIGQDSSYYGTYDYPYASLDYAIAHVEDNGTVRVRDSLTVATTTGNKVEMTDHGKTVTITGYTEDDDAETLHFPSSTHEDTATNTELYIRDNITFTGLEVTFPEYVFANGHTVVVESNVNLLNVATEGANNLSYIYGGGKTNTVLGTCLKLYAGSYSIIYGGAHDGKVDGNTYVEIGTGVNPNAQPAQHDARDYLLFGGCRKGTVTGDTKVVVQEGAKVEHLYGGGNNDDTVVEGSTYVEFEGQAYSVYGGSFKGTNGSTHVKMTGGTAYQVFGGCEGKSMEGNTDVQVLGGTVKRRIYGGCYNDDNNSWGTDYHVTGYAYVTIGPDAQASIALDSETDNSLYALTRDSISHDDEKGVFVFNDYKNCSANIGKIGPGTGMTTLWGLSSKAYHYQVNATSGGTVSQAGDCIYIQPSDETPTATVRLDSESGSIVYYAEEAGYYPLPDLVDGTRKVYVTFSADEQEDFATNTAAARIGNVYYAELDSAVKAAEKMENATIVGLNGTEELAAITIETTGQGTVKTDKLFCQPGEDVTLTVNPKEGYYCSSLSVTKDDGEVALNETFALDKKEYTFTTVDAGAYLVNATFAKRVFITPTSSKYTAWNLLEQNTSLETLSNGGTRISGTISATTQSGAAGNNNVITFVDEYTDIDLKLNVKEDKNNSTGNTPETRITYDFGDNRVFRISVYEYNGTVVIRENTSGVINKRLYAFTTEQEDNYRSPEGVELRIVKTDTQIFLYIDGKECAIGAVNNGGNTTQYYEGTEIDLSDFYSDNPITANTPASVNIRRVGDEGTQIDMPYSIANEVTLVGVDISETTNGTVTADRAHYFAGDTATLTVTPDTDYYCRSLSVTRNGEEEALNEDFVLDGTTYTFEVEEGVYEVQSTFAKRVFDTPTNTAATEWGLLEQNQSIENLANDGERISGQITVKSGTGNDVRLYLYKDHEYTDLDLEMTVMDSKSSTDGSPATIFTFDFGNSTVFQLKVYTTSGNVVVQAMNNSTYSGIVHTFTDEQKADYQSDKGVKLRIARVGTQIFLYLDGVECDVPMIELSEKGITAESKCSAINIRHTGDKGTTVTMPYSIANVVVPFVDIQETENGVITKDKLLYEVGDTVTLTVAPATDYYCRSLRVTRNGEEEALNEDFVLDGTTYTFEVEEGVYEVQSTFAKRVFDTPTNTAATEWGLLEQNQSIENLANDGERISGQITVKSGTGNDVRLYLYKDHEYTDLDLEMTVMDSKSSTDGSPATIFTFDFGNSTVFQLKVYTTSGNVVVQAMNNSTYSGIVHTFTDEQKADYQSDKGVKLRIARVGTQFFLYLDGVECDVPMIELSEKGITAESKCSAINIRHTGDKGTTVTMPYSIANKVSPATVEVKQSNTIVTTSNVPSNTQNADLDSNETYNVKLTPQGFDTTAYFKITYVDHVTNKTQSVYTPAIAAGESFEFTYKNGVFNTEKEANIATILWENRIKATKDVLTVEVMSGEPTEDIIEANATIGRAPMKKPSSTYPTTSCNEGAISTTGEIVQMANYVYSDPIAIEQAGTKITFTDTAKTDSHAGSDVLVISSWTEDANGDYVFDNDGTNIPGQYKPSKTMTFRNMTAEEAAEQGYDTFIERYKSDTIEYMYITSKPNEVIRLCYCAEEGTTEFPKIVQTYSGETGTAVEIALAAETDTWLEAQKTRDTYATYNELFAGKKISVIGDSYMEGSTISTDGDTNDLWISMFANKYDMTLENHGMNGSTVSNYAGSTYNPMVDRWATDFENDTPDIIIVEGGRNDYNYNVPMGEIGTTDTGTFKGAATYLISSLKEEYPNAIIIGLTCWEVGGNRNAAGYYCSDYGRALIEVCESLEIPYINAMQSDVMNVYMTSSNFMGRFCLKYNDVSHLNEKGMKLVLPIFEEKIYNICK